MGFQQTQKLKKELMHPWRRGLIRIGLPLYVLLSVGGMCAAIAVDALVFNAVETLGVLSYLGMAWFVLLSVLVLVVSAKITKMEVAAEKKKYAYLWQEPLPLEDGKAVIDDKSEGLRFTLNQDGVLIEWEEEESEQVFEEVRENAAFIAWADAELLIATRSVFRSAQIALAVFSERAVAPAFIPMCPSLFAAIHAFGLMEQISADLAYLLYNPDDALKQIIKSGRIVKMRNKETGKVFVDKGGNFTP